MAEFEPYEFEPYDFISTEYDLSMTKAEPNGTVFKYSNYVHNLKFNRFVSLGNLNNNHESVPYTYNKLIK